MDKETFLAKLAESTRQFVDAAIAPIAEQLRVVRAQVNGWEAVLEARLQKFVSEIEIDYRKVSEIIEPMIPKPVAGKDAVVDYGAIRTELKQLVDALPKAKDGADVDVERLNELIQLRVEEAVALIPKAKDGKNGESVDLDSIYAFVKGAVEQAVEQVVEKLPKPANGKDAVVDYDAIYKHLGDKVLPGMITELPKPEVDYKAIHDELHEMVAAIPKPKDAVVDWPLLMSKMSELLNALPKPRDGRDALNEDQLKEAITRHAFHVFKTFSQEMVAMNERDFVIRTTINGTVIEQQLHMPTPLYKGVWREGEYTQGDQVRRGGAVWHCNVERTTARPDSGSADWTLAVNKGADGKDFRPETKNELPVVRLK